MSQVHPTGTRGPMRQWIVLHQVIECTADGAAHALSKGRRDETLGMDFWRLGPEQTSSVSVFGTMMASIATQKAALQGGQLTARASAPRRAPVRLAVRAAAVAAEVPSPEKRTLMNWLLVGALSLPSAALLGPFAVFFVPVRCAACEISGPEHKYGSFDRARWLDGRRRLWALTPPAATRALPCASLWRAL